MKKILFVTAIAVLFLNQAFGQLELNSSGEVGIGASPLAGIDFYTPEAKVTHLGVNSSPINGIDFYTPEAKIQYLALGTTPSTSYRLLVSGVARFEASTVSAFQFSAYDMWEMQLLPSISLTNRIGSSSKQFYKIYGRYIYQ
ncbi:MAG: hypothetical protein KAH12_11310, partial [Anaerolineales bacterium]|nr:hypothetical protein [Anaerolineales bacterium]